MDPEEKYIRLVLKLLSSELESQVFLDREPEHIQGRIKSIARLMMRERGLDAGMVVTIKEDTEFIIQERKISL